MTQLTEFKKAFEEFGTIGGLAVAGSVLTPIISSASGLAPPWPKNLEFVAAMMMLLTLAMVFQFLPRRRSGYAKVFIAGAVLFVVTLAAQVTLHMRFVTDAPRIQGKLLMGCEWTRDMLRYARQSGELNLASQCPGDYRALLEMADNDPSQIWTAASIDRIALLLAGTWVMIFVSLAVALGSFVIYNSRQRSTRKTADPQAKPSAN